MRYHIVSGLPSPQEDPLVANSATLEISNGTDPSTYPRYLSFLVKNPLDQDWITSANDRDSTLGQRQQTWITRRKGSP